MELRRGLSLVGIFQIFKTAKVRLQQDRAPKENSPFVSRVEDGLG